MSENEVKNISEKSKKKKCFVITPIGNDDSEIRRHIDGIIDQAIVPAIEDKYEIEVAHRKYEIGSINDRVIRSVYESDLVIANLTNLNPNVMFELAIRYSFGKPAIVIAEKTTKLPFDITDENTIFYVNDPKGANDLKEAILKFENNINYQSLKYGPVYKSINKIPLYEAVESGENVSDQKLMTYLLDRLDSIEKSVKNNYRSNYAESNDFTTVEVRFDIDKLQDRENFRIELNSMLKSNRINIDYELYGVNIVFDPTISDTMKITMLRKICKLLEKYDIDDYKIEPISV